MIKFSYPQRMKVVLERVAVAAGLLVIFGIGFQLRTKGMYPVTQGMLYAANYDEGVYTEAAQLWLQGFLPYRDYLFVQPPLAFIIMAAVLKTHFVPWGDATSFVYERYAAIASGLLVILGVFAVAKKTGGWPASLVAGAVIALDGTVIQVDRLAMLEPYVNLFSVLAVLCYLLSLQRERTRLGWLVAAGVLGACAALVKATGILVLTSILLYAGGQLIAAVVQSRPPKALASTGDLVKGRVSEVVAILAGSLIVLIPLVGYFMIMAPDSFVKQVYLFQLFRPPDGPSSALERFSQILGYDASHLTLYLSGAGLAVVVLRGCLRRNWGKWVLILIWTTSILVVLAFSKTYYPHYYLQLAVPLSILAGGLVSREGAKAGRASDEKIRGQRTGRIILAAQIALCAFVVLTNWGPAQIEYERGQAVASSQSTLLRDISRVLSNRTSPTDSVLDFFPAYTFTASRKIVGPVDGQFMIDGYGYMQYVGLGMEEGWLPDVSTSNIMDLLHGEIAQAKVLEIAKRADDILFDQRAGWQLNPQTIAAMTIGYHLIYTRGQFSLWARN